MGVKIRQTVVRTYPVGEYLAQVSEIVEKDGTFGPQLQIAFKLTQMDADASPVLGWCSQTFSNKSKLYAWTKAIFGGGPIAKGYDFDSDDLLNKKVLITLVVRTREDGMEFNRIDSMRGIPAAGGVQSRLPGTSDEDDTPF